MHQLLRTTKAGFTVGILATLACSNGEAGSVEPKPSNPTPDVHFVVTLSPKLDTLPIGLSRTLTARVVDGAGATQNVAVTWTSLQPAVASVSDGTVTAVSAGSAGIVASYGVAADTATVVALAEGIHLQVLPSAVSASLGDTVAFRAQVVNGHGDSLGVPAVSWAARDSQAVTLVADGRIVTRAVGDVDVIAKVGELTAAASVNVFASPVGSVTINPQRASVNVGASIDLDAKVLDENGRRIKVRSVTWSTSNEAVATIDANGVVRGISRGDVIITAVSGAKSATAIATVGSQPAANVTLTIHPDTIVVGFQVRAVTTLFDAAGNPTFGRTITYHSSDPAVATVTASGEVVGVGLGSTTVTATCDGHVATVPLTVESQQVTSIDIVPGSPSVPNGSAEKLVAIVKDQSGRSMPNASVTWSSESPLIVTISPTGVVAGISLGTGSVKASSAGASRRADVAVTSYTIATVQVSPSAVTVPVNQTSTVVATGYHWSGQPILGTIMAWSVGDSAIASVSPLGVVTGRSKGTTTITAASAGHSGSTTVTVSEPPPAPVASVIVTVNSPTLDVGQATQAVATLFDAAGNELSGRTILWSSATPSLASVSGAGLASALAPGSVTISATAEGVSGLATVMVSAPTPTPVASVTVTRTADPLFVGSNAQLAVVLNDAQAAVLTGRSIAYGSSNTAVATVSSTGLVHAVGAGTTTISVTSEGVNGTVAITVLPTGSSPAPAYLVVVTMNATLLNVGETTQGIAVVKDSLGNPISGQIVTWSSSNTGVATVSSSGMVTAIGAGTVTISATAAGKVGSAEITVTAPPSAVASVSVTVGTSSLDIGQSEQAYAVAKDANGASIPDAVFTWSSSAPSILAVSASGLVSAVAVGSAEIQATTASVTGSVAVAVNPPLPDPDPSELVAPAALPQVYLNFPYAPATGRTISVPAGGNLQSAINSARRGDEIVLSAGATYTGNFVLPAEGGTVEDGWITIRTDRLSELPPEGTRVTPANADLMPKIVTTNSTAALSTREGASGYRLVGVEVTVTAAYAGPQYGLVLLGDGSKAQHTLAQVPSDLVLDRVYVHGQTNTQLSRCVALNSARTQVTDSYFAECHAKGQDSQAIAGWNGPGPYKIVNNTLMGAGENLMFGGADPGIPDLIPRDIEIRSNYIYTPPAWKGAWLKKNLFEMKVGQRVLVEGNVLDGSWTNGQTGFAFVLKSENQSGGCTWCTTSDVTIRYNYIRNVGGGMAISGKEGSSPHPVGALAARFSIRNNVMDNVNVGIFDGDKRFIQVLGNAQDVEITNNTMTSTGYMAAFLTFDNSNTVSRLAYNKNIASLAAYGMTATGRGEGAQSLAAVVGGWQFSSNYLIGAERNGYPAGTNFVSSLAAVPHGIGADQETLNTMIAGVVIIP